jgi:hypothetical protein
MMGKTPENFTIDFLDVSDSKCRIFRVYDCWEGIEDDMDVQMGGFDSRGFLMWV